MKTERRARAALGRRRRIQTLLDPMNSGIQLADQHAIADDSAVQFFFGTGSRYSYLAASQLPKLGEDTGARLIWRAVYSPELITRAGADPFAPGARRGQYQDRYRTRDATRWAAYYGIPYSEPDWRTTDWRRLALACIAADLRSRGDVFAACLFAACFADGAPPKDEHGLALIAERAGLPGSRFTAMLDDPIVQDRHERNIQDALELGVFGVPTFVTQDGELFFGQDRIPLLRYHLLQISRPGHRGKLA